MGLVTARPTGVDLATAVQMARVALGGKAPADASVADIDVAVLNIHGMSSLATRMWREAHEVCERARRRVGGRLRARFGARNPHGGALTILVLVLTFSVAAPLGLLNGVRLGSPEDAVWAAAVSSVIGGVALILALLTGFKPVARPTRLQSQLFAIGMVGSAVIGASVTTETTAWLPPTARGTWPPEEVTRDA